MTYGIQPCVPYLCAMIRITDQLNRPIHLIHTPKRIVSIVPSQTQLLADMGLDDSVCGITKFCVHPKTWRDRKTIVGGTKNIYIDRIVNLNPDLVIANKEENNREDVEHLSRICPVYVSDVATLQDALNMIADIGVLCDRRTKAADISQNIRNGFAVLPSTPRAPKRVLYLIWKNPWMAAGNDTFIHNMLETCGLTNVIDSPRYPCVDASDFSALKPDVIMLSSEPFPFKAKHLNEVQTLAPNADVMLVNGEYFSWYGSMLVGAPTYFQGLLR